MISYLFVSSLPAWVLILSPDSFRNRRKTLPCLRSHFILVTLSLHSWRSRRILQAHPNTRTPSGTSLETFALQGSKHYSNPKLLKLQSFPNPSKLSLATSLISACCFFYCYFLPFMKLYFSLFPQLDCNRCDDNAQFL